MAVYCGNNALHRSLKANGGNKIFGTHDLCFKKCYGIGFNAPVNNIAEIVAEWAGPYTPYIVQKLYYGNGKVPPGYQRATLAQSLQRGFALGRVARAKNMSRKSLAKTPLKASSSSSSKPTPPLPLKTGR